MSRPRKHSLSLRGHRTSVSLEDEFWQAFRAIAAEEGRASSTTWPPRSTRIAGSRWGWPRPSASLSCAVCRRHWHAASAGQSATRSRRVRACGQMPPRERACDPKLPSRGTVKCCRIKAINKTPSAHREPCPRTNARAFGKGRVSLVRAPAGALPASGIKGGADRARDVHAGADARGSGPVVPQPGCRAYERPAPAGSRAQAWAPAGRGAGFRERHRDRSSGFEASGSLSECCSLGGRLILPVGMRCQKIQRP